MEDIDKQIRTIKQVGFAQAFSNIIYAGMCCFLYFTKPEFAEHGFVTSDIGIPHVKELLLLVGFIGIALAYFLKKKYDSKINEIFEFRKRVQGITKFMSTEMAVAQILGILSLVYCLIIGDLIFSMIMFGIDFIASMGLIPSKQLFLGNEQL
jgi:hypothetical protein